MTRRYSTQRRANGYVLLYMKLQTSSESNPSDRDIVLLRIKPTPKGPQI